MMYTGWFASRHLSVYRGVTGWRTDTLQFSLTSPWFVPEEWTTYTMCWVIMDANRMTTFLRLSRLNGTERTTNKQSTSYGTNRKLKPPLKTQSGSSCGAKLPPQSLQHWFQVSSFQVFFISHCLHGIYITICHKFEASASKIFVQLN